MILRQTFDTKGSSSSSPVLSCNNDQAVALHHSGSLCSITSGGSYGAQIDQFYDDIKDVLVVSTPMKERQYKVTT